MTKNLSTLKPPKSYNSRSSQFGGGAVGSYVKALTEFALKAGEKIGPVNADLGHNSCQIPFAPDYIRKVEKRGTIGKKRKSVKC